MSQSDTAERYELLERIGIGGMAEVFRAKAFGAHGFEKVVAVKRILPELAARDEFVARFIAEAKLAVALTHANIVQVLDLAREGERLYIAMELVEGGDLAALLRVLDKRGEPPPLGFALFVGIELLRGLEHAHGRKDAQGRPLGVVHRDVSPSNILLSLAGEVKVADFGIARAALAAQLPERIMGKRRYMAPEQARGEEVDARSDVYAAAAVIYELCTGVPAFARGTEKSTQEGASGSADEIAARGLPKPPTELRPELPPALDAVILRSLSPDPSARHPSAGAFLAELEQVAFDSRIRLSAQEVAALCQEAFSGPRDERGERLDAAICAALGQKSDEVAEARRTSSLTGGLTGGLTTFFVRRDDGDGLPRWVLRSSEPGAAAAAGASSSDAASISTAPSPVFVGRRASDAAVAPSTATAERPSAAPVAAPVVAEGVATALPISVSDPAMAAVSAPGRGAQFFRLGFFGAVLVAAGLAIWSFALRGPVPADPAAAGGGATGGGAVGTALASGTGSSLAAIGHERDTARPTRTEARSDGGTATLTLKADLPAAVWLDGVDTGKRTPAVLEKLSIGEHSVELRVDGRVLWTERLVFTAGAQLHQELSLARRHTVLEVRTTPEGARVLLDGRSVGETPLKLAAVEVGPHTLKLSKGGFVSAELPVTLVAGAPMTVTRTLAPEAAYGFVNLFSEPWAYVTCDGRRCGTAPARALRLKAGRRKLVLTNPAAGLRGEVDVDVEANQTKLVKVELRP